MSWLKADDGKADYMYLYSINQDDIPDNRPPWTNAGLTEFKRTKLQAFIRHCSAFVVFSVDLWNTSKLPSICILSRSFRPKTYNSEVASLHSKLVYNSSISLKQAAMISILYQSRFLSVSHHLRDSLIRKVCPSKYHRSIIHTSRQVDVPNAEQRESIQTKLHTDKDIPRWQPWLFLPTKEGSLTIPHQSGLGGGDAPNHGVRKSTGTTLPDQDWCIFSRSPIRQNHFNNFLICLVGLCIVLLCMDFYTISPWKAIFYAGENCAGFLVRFLLFWLDFRFREALLGGIYIS